MIDINLSLLLDCLYVNTVKPHLVTEGGSSTQTHHNGCIVANVNNCCDNIGAILGSCPFNATFFIIMGVDPAIKSSTFP